MFRFFQRESKTIIGAATIVGVLSFASRLVGFVRDRILAGTFGAGDTLDVYYAAFKIPDTLFSLIVIGALSASFIPLFLANFQKSLGKQKAWEFTNNAIHLIGGAMIILSVVLMVTAQPLAQFMSPGFSEVKQLRVASFMRVMFLAQIILAVSMIYGSVLQSVKKFLLYSLAPIVYNLGIIFGALWLVDVLGPIGLAWGVVLGAVLHLGIQWLGVRESGYRYQFVANIHSGDVRKMIRLMGPRTIGLAVNQLLFLLLTIIASTLVVGSVTVFQFAYNIEFFPVGIIGVSFAIAVFPTLSELGEEKDLKSFRQLISRTIKQLVYLLLPMTLLFLIFRAQIVRVVVGAGAFDWAATIATADTLAFFALTFIPQSIVFLLARGFYALHDTITPLIVAIVSALTGILAAFLLRDPFGVVALAMAYSIASLVNAGLLWVSLRQRLQTLNEASMVPTFFKLAVCVMISGVGMQLLKPIGASLFALQTFFGVFFQAFFAGGIGLLLYIVAAHVLRVEEQKTFLQGIQRSTLRQSRPQEIAPD